MNLNEAESVVAIDDGNLNKECHKLPRDYVRAAYRSAEAKKDVAEAKSELAVIEADMAKDIRAEPATYGIEKITESAINSAVITSRDYIKAKQVLQDAEYEADLAQAVVWALEHKKRALTLLVDLYGMAYFSKPKVSQQGKEVLDQMESRRPRSRKDED